MAWSRCVLMAAHPLDDDAQLYAIVCIHAANTFFSHNYQEYHIKQVVATIKIIWCVRNRYSLIVSHKTRLCTSVCSSYCQISAISANYMAEHAKQMYMHVYT